MKSIMQEASSLIKAIEKGWEAAGKPQEFTVKIFEEAKKNFIGMTMHSAKIGIFFEDKKPVPVQTRTPQPIKKAPIRSSEPVITRSEKPVQATRPQQQRVVKDVVKQAMEQPQQLVKKETPIIWQPDLVQAAQDWIKGALATINQTEVVFNTQPSHYNLIVSFQKPLTASPEQEKQLMRSFSVLMMQALRHQFRRPLRGFKVVLQTLV